MFFIVKFKFPTSALGKISGGLSAVCGIILLAMPISLLAANFSDSYKYNSLKKKIKKSHQAKMNESVEKSKNNKEENKDNKITPI